MSIYEDFDSLTWIKLFCKRYRVTWVNITQLVTHPIMQYGALLC